MSGGEADADGWADERTVTNPLTDEHLVVRELINRLSDSDRLDVLQAISEGESPSGLSTIANQGDISRRTVSSHVSECLS